MNPQKKIKPYRNPDYEKWIDNGQCKVCYCPTPTHHHIRDLRWGAGTGIKPHSYTCVRRCDIHGCHDPKYDNMFGREKEIIDNLRDYFSEKYGDFELIEVLMKAIEERR